MRNQRSGIAAPRRTFNKYPTAPDADGRGASTVQRRQPHGKDPLAVEHHNDILEESEADHYYVFRGDPGANAVRVIYLDNEWIIEEPTIAQSLDKAKIAVRAYRKAHGLDGQFWPDIRWATIAPVKL